MRHAPSGSPDAAPMSLDYRATADEVLCPDTKAVWTFFMLVIATAAFALAHWVTDYGCHYLYHGMSTATYATPTGRRAIKSFENDMMIETVFTFLCAPIFLAAQCLLWSRRARRVRRYAVIVAIGSGAAFCLARWFIGLTFAGIPEMLNLLTALLLAGVAGTAVALYRWPRGL